MTATVPSTLVRRSLSAADMQKLGIHPSIVAEHMNFVKNFLTISTQFQVLKNGTQTTTGAFAPLTGWTQERSIGSFTLDSASGEVTFQLKGEYVLDASVLTTGAVNLKAQIYSPNTGVWSDLAGAIDTGSTAAKISGYIFTASMDSRIRLEVSDNGVHVNITSNNARLSLRRIA